MSPIWSLNHKLTCEVALGITVDGHEYVASGGNNEGLCIWDCRQQRKPLYEISLGNHCINFTKFSLVKVSFCI